MAENFLPAIDGFLDEYLHEIEFAAEGDGGWDNDWNDQDFESEIWDEE